MAMDMLDVARLRVEAMPLRTGSMFAFTSDARIYLR